MHIEKYRSVFFGRVGREFSVQRTVWRNGDSNSADIDVRTRTAVVSGDTFGIF